MANKNNQRVGEKNDLYITMEQLHREMFEIQQEELRARSGASGGKEEAKDGTV